MQISMLRLSISANLSVNKYQPVDRNTKKSAQN